MADVLRPPYVVRINVRPATAAQTQGPSNRLALTATVAQAPFAQYDWTNPQRKTFPVALRGHLNPFPINLYGKDQFFAAPGMGPDYDHPNPLRKRPAHVGFTSSILPQLYGQDTFFGPGGYGPDYDYPNPTLRRKVQQPEIPQNRLALTAAPVSAPFNAQDFPNPLRRPRAQQFDAQGRTLDPQPPFAGFAFDNPQRRRAVQQQTAGRTLDPQAPFAGFAFDNPVRRRGPAFDLFSPNLVLFAVVPAPFTQADWPNPRRAARPVELHPQLYVGLFPVGPKPFAQTDWPNPLRSHAVSDWSWPIVADQAQPPIIPPHDCSFVAHALTPVPLTASALTVSGLTAKPLSSDTLTAPPPNEDC